MSHEEANAEEGNGGDAAPRGGSAGTGVEREAAAESDVVPLRTGVTREQEKKARQEEFSRLEKRLYIQKCAKAAMTGLLAAADYANLAFEPEHAKIASRAFDIGYAMWAERERRFK